MQPEKTKRAFKFHTKVRSGCRTCKARKVKCDEAKPYCSRCISTGRHCEGYVARTPSPPLTAAHAALVPSYPGLFDSPAEKRSFQFFQSHASKVLGGSFAPAFWGREVMQAAIHYPPIRHLVVALGAAYEDLEAGALSGNGKRHRGHNGDFGDDREFALQQCNRSIRQLATLSSAEAASGRQAPETVYCVITASILFIYLASIRGHMAEAIQHTRSAIRVLQDLEDRVESSPGTTPPSFPVPLAQLRALLTSVYGQLRCMIEDVLLEVSGRDMLVTGQKPATIFLSLTEAHAYVERLFHNCLAFFQTTTRYPPSTPEQLKAMASRHRQLCESLESSQGALDALEASLRPQQSQDWEVENGILILRVYQILLSIRLRINILRPDRRESAFDNLEAQLEEMVTLCEQIVANEKRIRHTSSSSSSPPSPSSPSCVAGLGFVMPLHTVASRCRNPRIRRRAVQLLLECSRREGIWDSLITGKVVAQTVELEEEFMDPAAVQQDQDPELKEQGRVWNTKIELQGERSALIRFQVVGRGEVQKLIRW